MFAQKLIGISAFLALSISAQPGVAQTQRIVQTNRDSVKFFYQEFPANVRRMQPIRARIVNRYGVRLLGLFRNKDAVTFQAPVGCERGTIHALAMAQNYPERGFPIVSLQLNGREVGKGQIVGERVLDNYRLNSKPVSFSQGSTFTLSFTNDSFSKGKGDRNVFLHSFGFKCQ